MESNESSFPLRTARTAIIMMEGLRVNVVDRVSKDMDNIQLGHIDHYCRLGIKWGVLSFMIVGFLYIACVCIYRIFFHPLAKYPGPFLGKIVNQRAAYMAWTGDLHVDIWKCHEKYGSFVRYAPDRLLINTTEGMKGEYSSNLEKHGETLTVSLREQDIYGFGKNFAKAQGYAAMTHNAPSTFTVIEKKEHGKKRRVMSQGFSDAAIRSIQPKIIAQIQKFCRTVCDPEAYGHGNGWSPPQNMALCCDYLFFDIITDVVFGRTINLLEEPKYRSIIHAIEESNVRISVIVQDPWITLARLDKLLFPTAVIARNMFLRFMRKVVGERLMAERREDIISILLDAKDPETGEGLTLPEIGAEATTLLVAGSDTSSTLMASMFFYLSRNPQCFEKAIKEVRENFTSPDEIRIGPKLNSCKYLRACLDECLRISPPVGAVPFREVLKGGATIDGHYIPEGMLVGCGIYAMHHNSGYFRDPLTYNPDRWLSDLKNESSVTATGLSAYSPFSMGPRSCIGKGLALTEAMLAMATVCWGFDFRATDISGANIGGGKLGLGEARNRVNEFQLSDHITSAKTGPMIQFRPRQMEMQDEASLGS